MRGKPIMNALKRGTLELENQMKARRITLITGVALRVVTKGLRIKEIVLFRPPMRPRILPLMTMMTKERRALRTVERIFVEKVGPLVRERRAVKIGPKAGMRTGIFTLLAITCQSNKRPSEEAKRSTFRLVLCIHYPISRVRCPVPSRRSKRDQG